MHGNDIWRNISFQNSVFQNSYDNNSYAIFEKIPMSRERELILFYIRYSFFRQHYFSRMTLSDITYNMYSGTYYIMLSV